VSRETLRKWMTKARANASSTRGRGAGHQSGRRRCSVGSVSGQPLTITISSRLSRSQYLHALLRITPPSVGASRSQCLHPHRRPKQDRVRHGSPSPPKRPPHCDPRLLGIYVSQTTAFFPVERYGASGDGATVVYESDPTRPIGRWKEAWETAKIRAGVSCRFHDLRHTGCTRMLEAGVPFSVVATIMGWSPSTTVRMARRYGHIGQTAQRQAVNALRGADFKGDGAQNWAQSQRPRVRQLAN
jgi:Phage integrase family